MNRKSLLILTILSVLNSTILALFSYLTVFMYKNSIGQSENLASAVIFISFFIAFLMKILKRKLWTIIASLVSDIILVLFFLYNVTDFDSFSDFVKSLLNIETHTVLVLYLYLIVYYFLIFKDYNKIELDKLIMTKEA